MWIAFEDTLPPLERFQLLRRSVRRSTTPSSRPPSGSSWSPWRRRTSTWRGPSSSPPSSSSPAWPPSSSRSAPPSDAHPRSAVPSPMQCIAERCCSACSAAVTSVPSPDLAKFVCCRGLCCYLYFSSWSLLVACASQCSSVAQSDRAGRLGCRTG